MPRKKSEAKKAAKEAATSLFDDDEEVEVGEEVTRKRAAPRLRLPPFRARPRPPRTPAAAADGAESRTRVSETCHAAAAPQFVVNKEYARKFQHNKEREELHRLKEKHPEVVARMERRMAAGQLDDDESSSDDEESDDGYIPDVTGEWRGGRAGDAAGLRVGAVGNARFRPRYPVYRGSCRESSVFRRCTT